MERGKVVIIQYKGQHYNHYGISDGEGGIIHVNKKEGKITNDSLLSYSKKIKKIKYLDDDEITMENTYKNAIQMIDKPYNYNFFTANCETWVNSMREGEKYSKQVDEWCNIGTICLFALGTIL